MNESTVTAPWGDEDMIRLKNGARVYYACTGDGELVVFFAGGLKRAFEEIKHAVRFFPSTIRDSSPTWVKAFVERHPELESRILTQRRQRIVN